jgi:1-acyl-sn-glycerol-3-phosphate acyltransferase
VKAKKPRILNWLLYELVRGSGFILGKLFCGFAVHGSRHIPPRGGFIIASNHVSYLDPLVVGMGCRRHLNFMARDTLFQNRVFGEILLRINAFPLKRNSADMGALKEGIRRIQAGGGLVVFPEGERVTSQSEKRKPLAGVGFLADKVRVPVVPAYVQGTDRVLPKGSKSIRFHKLRVHFGQAIDFHEGMEYQAIADMIMERIQRLREGAPTE